MSQQPQTPFQQTYPSGKIVQVTVPNTLSYGGGNFVFQKWENGLTDVTRNITVTSDTVLTATYIPSTVEAGFPWWAIPIVVGIAYFALKETKKQP